MGPGLKGEEVVAQAAQAPLKLSLLVWAEGCIQAHHEIREGVADPLAGLVQARGHTALVHQPGDEVGADLPFAGALAAAGAAAPPGGTCGRLPRRGPCPAWPLWRSQRSPPAPRSGRRSTNGPPLRSAWPACARGGRRPGGRRWPPPPSRCGALPPGCGPAPGRSRRAKVQPGPPPVGRGGGRSSGPGPVGTRPSSGPGRAPSRAGHCRRSARGRGVPAPCAGPGPRSNAAARWPAARRRGPGSRPRIGGRRCPLRNRRFARYYMPPGQPGSPRRSASGIGG